MTIITAFFQMLTLLILIAAGVIATKAGMMDEHLNTQMSKMIVSIFNPLLVFASAANSVGKIPLQLMGQVAIVIVGMYVVFILAGTFLAPFFDKDPAQRKIFQLMLVFSNLGFVGIPVVTSLLGSEYVVYVSEFLVINSLVLYTYGIALMDGKFSFSSLRSMVSAGNIITLAALAVILFNIRLPEFVRTAATYLGNVTSPMALMAVGFTLANSDWKKIFTSLRLYLFAAVKLLGLPLILLPLVRLVTDDPHIISVCMVMFGMPVGNMPLMLGNERGIDGRTCTAAIIMTTILCVVTIPVLLEIAA